MDESALILRLRKVDGQVRAVERMIRDGRTTESILVQLNAASSALDKVAKMLLEESILKRLEKLDASEEEKETSITEIRRLFSMK